jgi:putative iron-dependent peroxidase
MSTAQPGILADETKLARYLTFSLDSLVDVEGSLQDLAEIIDPAETVIGVGSALLTALGKEVPAMKIMPAQTANGVVIPSTPTALWCWLRGNDRGEIYHRSRLIVDCLTLAFTLEDVVDTFQYDANRDLSGYEDGTENPQGDEAVAAAIVQGQGQGLDGGSFVAVQQWLHDFDMLEQMTEAERDDVIGRHVSDNEEFDAAPESAHVKRAAQESFQPEAFILRRSMPWADDMSAGLMFVAFGKSFDAFEALLTRMLGNEDGITDGLFTFTRPVTGSYFWCPPIKDDKLDFSKLDL